MDYKHYDEDKQAQEQLILEETKEMLIGILEQAKVKFLKQQDYDMAIKIRSLIKLEQMEEGSEERREYVKEMLRYYREEGQQSK